MAREEALERRSEADESTRSAAVAEEERGSSRGASGSILEPRSPLPPSRSVPSTGLSFSRANRGEEARRGGDRRPEARFPAAAWLEASRLPPRSAGPGGVVAREVGIELGRLAEWLGLEATALSSGTPSKLRLFRLLPSDAPHLGGSSCVLGSGAVARARRRSEGMGRPERRSWSGSSVLSSHHVRKNPSSAPPWAGSGARRARRGSTVPATTCPPVPQRSARRRQIRTPARSKGTPTSIHRREALNRTTPPTVPSSAAPLPLPATRGVRGVDTWPRGVPAAARAAEFRRPGLDRRRRALAAFCLSSRSAVSTPLTNSSRLRKPRPCPSALRSTALASFLEAPSTCIISNAPSTSSSSNVPEPSVSIRLKWSVNLRRPTSPLVRSQARIPSQARPTSSSLGRSPSRSASSSGAKGSRSVRWAQARSWKGNPVESSTSSVVMRYSCAVYEPRLDLPPRGVSSPAAPEPPPLPALG
mmetsp:Transcript_38313/g.85528  ORF Transcript_38313/g.85528 Transcript_38313/m.85528 type:complete len:474 (-) Transcript_38313:715-2136(-)